MVSRELELLDRITTLERDFREVAEELSDLDIDYMAMSWAEDLEREAGELRRHLIRLWAQVAHGLGLEIPLRRWDEAVAWRNRTSGAQLELRLFPE